MIISKVLKRQIKFEPELFLLNMVESKEDRKHLKFILYLVTAARMVYAQKWKDKEVPSIDEWLMKSLEMLELDKLTMYLRGKWIDDSEDDWTRLKEFCNKIWI